MPRHSHASLRPPAFPRAPTRARHARERGFTLMEILVVITLIALISGAVGVSVMNHLMEAKVKLARVDAATVRQAARVFQLNEGHCPTMEQLQQSGGLDEETRTEDPWETPFHLDCDNGPRVLSAGPDREFGTDDDIGSAHGDPSR
ncbi:MAG: prepilin-type N-terminal cleavage/methylation domain-containing protein [Polyangiales bacterium]